jgi:hypothetical protein
MHLSFYRCLLLLLALTAGIYAAAQKPNAGSSGDTLPKEMRGYKVERAKVEVKKSKDSDKESAIDEEILIRFGEARLVTLTPLGVTFDVPVIVSAVKQQGDVELLVFEDMGINDTPVTIEDYLHPFALPNKEPLTLSEPVRVFVSSPQVLLTTIDEFFNSKEVWPVTGRIYVCGHFKKFLLKFKRAVPVEVKASINNPLRVK